MSFVAIWVVATTCCQLTSPPEAYSASVDGSGLAEDSLDPAVSCKCALLNSLLHYSSSGIQV